MAVDGQAPEWPGEELRLDALDCRLWKIVDDGGQSSRRNREGLVVPIVGIEGHYAALQLVISGLRLHADLEVGVLFGIGRGGTAWPDERCVEGQIGRASGRDRVGRVGEI